MKNVLCFVIFSSLLWMLSPICEWILSILSAYYYNIVPYMVQRYTHYFYMHNDASFILYMVGIDYYYRLYLRNVLLQLSVPTKTMWLANAGAHCTDIFYYYILFYLIRKFYSNRPAHTCIVHITSPTQHIVNITSSIPKPIRKNLEIFRFLASALYSFILTLSTNLVHALVSRRMWKSRYNIPPEIHFDV